jgi:hypothetical protein
MATLDTDDRLYLEALFTPLRDDIDRHERLLIGNGQPGLIADVASLKSRRSKDALSIGAVVTIIATVITSILSGINPSK